MAGGLMNLVSEGQQNIILNGNPSKTFFKTTYAKYTNFGLQKFRVDFDGTKTLRLNEESYFTFKIPRYGDLLMDSYLSITLPTIWSPIFPPLENTVLSSITGATGYSGWAPYEFRWIQNLGALMISKISITCGNQTLQEYSGAYLLAMVQRDFPDDKKKLFDKMIGNIPELNDPANSGSRVNSYPNAHYTDNPAGAEPSIRGTILYVPINSWFSLNSQMSFPLVALQYNELHINVTFRPISEMFQIRDVFDQANNFPYVSPNFNYYYMQLHRFLQPPPDVEIGISSYIDTRTQWNANIHLICTYGFLSNDESRIFALNEQTYLIKQVYESIFYNVTGPNKVELNSLGMVASQMFYFQRSDANLRNEWSNYSNWPYNYLPYDLIQAPTNGIYPVFQTDSDGKKIPVFIGPGVNPDGKLTGWMITGDYNSQNTKEILLTMGILFDGEYRENMQPAGVYNYIEKYTRTPGNAPDGLYCYNYCLNTSPFVLQPSGAINMSKFNKIELEFVTIIPQLDPLAQVLTICDPITGTIIGINKPTWRIYDYNFNLIYFEERLNVIRFISGNCGVLYAN
uniref:Major capsid protein N-terminal domain-containing protein n=1 Tax=viral metagenome TaxID=1070528 RepID=A0A6C0E450_9ZZZZ